MNTAGDERELPFQSGHQRARVCRALLALVDATEAWTPTGPALSARGAPPRGVEPDVRRILAACWALWEGSSTLSLSELLLLRPSLLEAVGELITALARGAVAVDAWLSRFEPAQGLPASPTQSRRTAAAGPLKLTR
jgi:hypothetical protein